ncbi:hypothetical protein Tco_1013164 [Tanacetum coccineum]
MTGLMTDSRPVLEQYNELLGILGRFTQHKMNMNEAIQVSYIIDKLPPSWKDFKHNLKHKKEELTLVELRSPLRIKESLRVYNDSKGKRKHHDNTRADPNKKAKLLVENVAKLVTLKGIAKVVMLEIKPMDQTQRVQMMMLRGGLTEEQLFMCVKIDAGSRPMSH